MYKIDLFKVKNHQFLFSGPPMIGVQKSVTTVQKSVRPVQKSDNNRRTNQI